MRFVLLHKNLFSVLFFLLLSTLFVFDCCADTTFNFIPETQNIFERTIYSESRDQPELPDKFEPFNPLDFTILFKNAEDIANLIFNFSITLPEITWNLESVSGLMVAYSEIQEQNLLNELSNQVRYYVPLPYWTTILDLQMEDLFWVRTTLCAGAPNSFDFQRAFWNLELASTRTFMEFELIGLKSLLLDRRLYLNPYAGYAYLDYRRNLNATLYEKTIEGIDRRYHSLIAGAEITYNPYNWISLESFITFSPFGRLVKEELVNENQIPGVLQLNYGGKVQINAFLFSINFLFSRRNVFEVPVNNSSLKNYIHISEYGFQVTLRL